jgi:hypothetical protein
MSDDNEEDHTHDGRKHHMLKVVGEFTRECLSIRIKRKFKSSPGSPHFGDSDMEEADRVDLERLLGDLPTPDMGSASDAMALRQILQALLTKLYRSTDRLSRCGAAMKSPAQSASVQADEKIAPSSHGIKHVTPLTGCPVTPWRARLQPHLTLAGPVPLPGFSAWARDVDLAARVIPADAWQKPEAVRGT